VQLQHRALHVTGEHQRKNLERAPDRGIDVGALLQRRPVQHVFRHGIPVAGVADADAQAPVVVRRQPGRDVLQPVVAGGAAALLHLHRARREIELVVRHQDVGGRDLEEAREHLHRPPARVHEVLRQHQPGAARLVAADQRLELGVLAQRRVRLRREALDQPEAGVVPGGLVAVARVAEADDEFHQDP
jgi:hypothetical protein